MMMKNKTLSSIHIDNNKRPASTFSTKKPRAGLLLNFSDGSSEDMYVAKDTARLVMKYDNELIGLSKDELKQKLDSYDYEACWSKLLALIKRRDYSCHDIQNKLKGVGFQTESIDQAINNAQRRKFLNDKRFANAYVIGKINSGWGRARIEKELMHKGIDLTLLEDDVASMLEEDLEFERAYEIAIHKTLAQTNPEQKLVRFLVGRGFSFSVALSVARMRIENINKDN